jgi:hypothetical protein
VKTESGWVYYDPTSGHYLLCSDRAEMVMLYGLLHSPETDIARSALSHWIAATLHPECEASGHLR